MNSGFLVGMRGVFKDNIMNGDGVSNFGRISDSISVLSFENSYLELLT